MQEDSDSSTVLSTLEHCLSSSGSWFSWGKYIYLIRENWKYCQQREYMHCGKLGKGTQRTAGVAEIFSSAQDQPHRDWASSLGVASPVFVVMIMFSPGLNDSSCCQNWAAREEEEAEHQTWELYYYIRPRYALQGGLWTVKCPLNITMSDME